MYVNVSLLPCVHSSDVFHMFTFMCSMCSPYVFPVSSMHSDICSSSSVRSHLHSYICSNSPSCLLYVLHLVPLQCSQCSLLWKHASNANQSIRELWCRISEARRCGYNISLQQSEAIRAYEEPLLIQRLIQYHPLHSFNIFFSPPQYVLFSSSIASRFSFIFLSRSISCITNSLIQYPAS